MAYDPAIGQVLLFGGQSSSGNLGDSWAWNGTTWAQLAPTTSPSARDNGALAYDSATSQMVFFSGYTTTYVNQTWLIGAPSVTAISPESGPTSGGTSVTITGSGFTGVSGVNFGSTSTSGFVVNSSTSITVTAPAGNAGTVDVTVTTSGGTSPTSGADQFTIPISTGSKPLRRLHPLPATIRTRPTTQRLVSWFSSVATRQAKRETPGSGTEPPGRRWLPLV